MGTARFSLWNVNNNFASLCCSSRLKLLNVQTPRPEECSEAGTRLSQFVLHSDSLRLWKSQELTWNTCLRNVTQQWWTWIQFRVLQVATTLRTRVTHMGLLTSKETSLGKLLLCCMWRREFFADIYNCFEKNCTSIFRGRRDSSLRWKVTNYLPDYPVSYTRFGGTSCVHLQDRRESTFFRNVDDYLPDYTASH